MRSALVQQIQDLEEAAAGKMPEVVVVGVGPYNFRVGRWDSYCRRYDLLDTPPFSSQSEAEAWIARRCF